MEKSCENCHKCFAYESGILHGQKMSECRNDNYKYWNPSYQTLESQLAAANEEIRGLMELYESTEAVKAFMVMPKSYWDDDWEYEEKYDLAKKRYDNAKQDLSHPAPVDEEKEVLKETINLMVAGTNCIRKKCPNTNMDCRDCKIQYYINQARSRIEEGKK
jgi:hypothetical protein